MTPEERADRMTAHLVAGCGITSHDFREFVRSSLVEAIRAAEIEALEWAARQAIADCHCEPDFTGGHSCGGTRISGRIKAEIERRKKV